MIDSKHGLVVRIEGWTDSRSAIFGEMEVLHDRNKKVIRVRVINQDDCLLPLVPEATAFREITIPAREFEKFLMDFVKLRIGAKI